jgi:hypothetical protein
MGHRTRGQLFAARLTNVMFFEAKGHHGRLRCGFARQHTERYEGTYVMGNIGTNVCWSFLSGVRMTSLAAGISPATPVPPHRRSTPPQPRPRRTPISWRRLRLCRSHHALGTGRLEPATICMHVNESKSPTAAAALQGHWHSEAESGTSAGWALGGLSAGLSAPRSQPGRARRRQLSAFTARPPAVLGWLFDLAAVS